MICQPCKDGNHCGRKECTCQHRVKKENSVKPERPIDSLPAILTAILD